MDRCSANRVPLTPITFLERSAAVYGDRISLVYGSVRYTWRETLQRCTRLASALVHVGISRGDVMENSSINRKIHTFKNLVKAAIDFVKLEPSRLEEKNKNKELALLAPRLEDGQTYSWWMVDIGEDHQVFVLFYVTIKSCYILNMDESFFFCLKNTHQKELNGTAHELNHPIAFGLKSIKIFSAFIKKMEYSSHKS